MISLFKIISELRINKPEINYQNEWDRIRQEVCDEWGIDLDDEDDEYYDENEDDVNRETDERFEELYPGIDLYNLQEDNITSGGESYNTKFAFKKSNLNELKINKPGGRKISLQSFKDNMKNWFKPIYEDADDKDGFEELCIDINSIKYKKDLIEFIRNEDTIEHRLEELIDFIIDNTVNI